MCAQLKWDGDWCFWFYCLMCLPDYSPEKKKEYVKWVFIFLRTVQLSKTHKHLSLILSMITEGRQIRSWFLKPLSWSLICLHFHVFVMLTNLWIKLPAYNIFGWTVTTIRANKTSIHLLWSIASHFTMTDSAVHSFKTFFWNLTRGQNEGMYLCLNCW